MDRTGADTDRHYQSGAVKVIASSPDKQTLVKRVPDDASLNSLVSSIGPGVDLVVVEGFKASAVPKILVLADNEKADQFENVIATVGSNGKTLGVPHFPLDDVDGLTSLIRDQLFGVAAA